MCGAGHRVPCVASAIDALHIGATNVDRGVLRHRHPRSYQLLAGAALALTPQLLTARAPAAWCGRRRVRGGRLGRDSVHDEPDLPGCGRHDHHVVLIVALENVRAFRQARVVDGAGDLPRTDFLRHLLVALAGSSCAPTEPRSAARPAVRAHDTDRDRVAALSFHLIEHPLRVARPRPLPRPGDRDRLLHEHPRRRARDAGGAQYQRHRARGAGRRPTVGTPARSSSAGARRCATISPRRTTTATRSPSAAARW